MFFNSYTFLSVDSQDQTDDLPEEIIKQVKEITIGISLYQTDVDNINFLRKCVQAQKLTIQKTEIVDLPLENTVKLKTFYIEECQNLKNLNGLENCLEIQSISIMTMNITSIAVIKKLKKLKEVAIWECELIADYEVIEDCTGLTYISFRKTNIQDISPIANLQNLVTFTFENNKLIPQEFNKDIRDNKQEVQLFLDTWKQTQQYKDYEKKRLALQQVIQQQKVPNTQALTLDNQIQETNEQLQQKLRQRELNIQNHTALNQQVIKQIQQMNLNFKQQMQQVQQNMQSQMQQIMNQIINMNSNLQQQIEQNQVVQDERNDKIQNTLSELELQQAVNNHQINQQFTSIIHKLVSEE